MKKIFKAIIADDERLARSDLKTLLTSYENIEIVDEADNIKSTIEAIDRSKPDVIFLDIQMPGESGFDLFEKTKVTPKVIFITAHDEYAIRAFEVNALDYLLKPIHPRRLDDAIERLEIEDIHDERERELDYEDRLFLTLDSQMLFLKIKTIICIHAAGDYTEVITKDGNKGLALKSMKEWEKRLPKKYFVRIHRSSIINMECIDHLEEWFNYSYRVHIKGIKEPLVMSRRYSAKLKQVLC